MSGSARKKWQGDNGFVMDENVQMAVLPRSTPRKLERKPIEGCSDATAHNELRLPDLVTKQVEFKLFTYTIPAFWIFYSIATMIQPRSLTPNPNVQCCTHTCTCTCICTCMFLRHNYMYKFVETSLACTCDWLAVFERPVDALYLYTAQI